MNAWIGKTPLSLVLLAGAVKLAGCASPSTDQIVPIRMDSSGIGIVEYRTTPVEQHWTVEVPAVLEVGNVEGASGSELYLVQGATRTSDGRIVVIDGSSQSLRIFGPDGKYVRTTGRRGSGPGEFGYITSIWSAPGDTILVWDQRQQRLTRFDQEGNLVETTPLRPPQAMPVFLGTAPDGTWILAVYGDREPVRTHVIRDVWHLIRYEPGAAAFDTIADCAGEEVYETTDPTGRPMHMEPPLGLGGFLGVQVNEVELQLSQPPAFDLRSLDMEGRLRRIVRWPARRVAVDAEAMVERMVPPNARGPGGEQGRGQVEKMIRGLPFPDSTPPFLALKRDAEGNAWLEEFTWPRSGAMRRWVVISPTGELKATAELPEGIDVLHVGADYLLGLRRDSMRLEKVGVYMITKG